MPSTWTNFKRLDRLRHVVFGDLEVVHLQIGDRLVAALRDGDVDAHEIGAGPEDRLLRRRLRRRRLLLLGRNAPRSATERGQAAYSHPILTADVRPKQWDVLGVGCNSVDYVYRLPASPKADSPTAKLRISSHSTMCGGQMATAMAACAGFGLQDGLPRLRRPRPQRPPDPQRARAARRRRLPCPDARVRQPVCRHHRRRNDRRAHRAVGSRRAAQPRRAREIRSGADRVGAARSRGRRGSGGGDCAPRRWRGAPACRARATSIASPIAPRELVAAVSIPIFAQHVLPAITGESDVERALRAVRQIARRACSASRLARAARCCWPATSCIVEPGFADEGGRHHRRGRRVPRRVHLRAAERTTPPREMLRFANAAAAVSCTRAGAMAGVPALRRGRTTDLLSGAMQRFASARGPSHRAASRRSGTPASAPDRSARPDRGTRPS